MIGRWNGVRTMIIVTIDRRVNQYYCSLPTSTDYFVIKSNSHSCHHGNEQHKSLLSTLGPTTSTLPKVGDEVPRWPPGCEDALRNVYFRRVPLYRRQYRKQVTCNIHGQEREVPTSATIMISFDKGGSATVHVAFDECENDTASIYAVARRCVLYSTVRVSYPSVCVSMLVGPTAMYMHK